MGFPLEKNLTLRQALDGYERVNIDVSYLERPLGTITLSDLAQRSAKILTFMKAFVAAAPACVKLFAVSLCCRQRRREHGSVRPRPRLVRATGADPAASRGLPFSSK